MLTSEFGFLYALAIMAGLWLLLRLLHKNLDKLWARILFTPFGPKTNVRYMTRSKLFKSALTFFICGGYLVLLLVFIILLMSPYYKNRDPGTFFFALLCIILPIFCSIFFAGSFYLFIRALIRSKNYIAPNSVLIRDSLVPQDRVSNIIESCRSQNWQRQNYSPKYGLVRKKTAFLNIVTRYSGQEYDHDKFDLVPNSWKYDNCKICSCKICDSNDPETSIAYTNGRDWLCSECYQKFVHSPDLQTVPF